MNGIILAGGKNSRISMPKALIRMDKYSIIENTVNLFRDLFDDIIIVSNRSKDYVSLGVKLTEDLIPGKGPLCGIYSGLTVSSNYYNFVVACDMPFIEPTIIRYLQKNIKDDIYDVIVPEYNGFLEPLFAIYTKKCIHPIAENLKRNQLKIRDFFNYVKVKEVSCNRFTSAESSFFNINTREDLQLARKLKCG